jgi:hypothetical protein
LNSNDTIAYFNRGDAYFAQSNLTAAIAGFEYTISTAPSSSAAVSAAVLLHVDMKRRQGHDDAQQLARVAAAADLSKWPGPVLKLDLGQATANEVMVAAASGAPLGRSGRFGKPTASPARTRYYIINGRRRWRASRPRAMAAQRVIRATPRRWQN